MLDEPKCRKRKCRHYRGVKQDNEGEATERNVCEAFPDGIPNAIAYGDNMHISPYPSDNGIRYEPIKQ